MLYLQRNTNGEINGLKPSRVIFDSFPLYLIHLKLETSAKTLSKNFNFLASHTIIVYNFALNLSNNIFVMPPIEMIFGVSGSASFVIDKKSSSNTGTT